MKYYSTNHTAPIASLHEAVVKGLAPDRGLYMPERIKKLPKDFLDNIDKLSFQEIAYNVADAFFGEDIKAEDLKRIVYDTLTFDCPIKEVEDNIYSLELYHGPTLAFKDVAHASWHACCNISYAKREQRMSTCLLPQVATRDLPWQTVSLVSMASTFTCSTLRVR